MSGPMPGTVISCRQLSLPCASCLISSVTRSMRSSRRRQSPPRSSMIAIIRGDGVALANCENFVHLIFDCIGGGRRRVPRGRVRHMDPLCIRRTMGRFRAVLRSAICAPSPTSTPNSAASEARLDGDSALRGRPLVGPKWRRLYAIAAQRLRAIERSIGRIE